MGRIAWTMMPEVPTDEGLYIVHTDDDECGHDYTVASFIPRDGVFQAVYESRVFEQFEHLRRVVGWAWLQPAEKEDAHWRDALAEGAAA